MKIHTISELESIKGKRILLRTDFNVPFKKNGEISDNSRIVKTLKTIKYLQKKGAKIIIITHIGRPEGKIVKKLSTKNIQSTLEELLKTKIFYINQSIGKKAEKSIKNLKTGEILLLENIRFNKEEELCDIEFSKKLAKLGDIYVNDAFSASHRKHSSTYQIAKYLPAFGGFLMEEEIKNMEIVLTNKIKRPFTIILGGAKIDTKIGLIKNFLNKANYILIGGAIANTFLKAENQETGKSLIELEKVKTAKNLQKLFKNKKTKLIIPIDYKTCLEIKENAITKNKLMKNIEKNEIIIDIGTKTENLYSKIIKQSKTIVLNGPMGIFEIKNFSSGTKKIITEIKNNHKAISIIGGGDTVDALKRFRISEKNYSHVSTGGGASIEFLEGKTLPGIKVLMKTI